MERLKARLPPLDYVATAFCDFFEHKHNAGEAVEDIHAQYALQALNYIRKEGYTPAIDMDVFQMALMALTVTPRQPSQIHQELAVALYDTICHHGSHAEPHPEPHAESGIEPQAEPHAHARASVQALSSLVHVLSSIGSTSLARDYLTAFERDQARLSNGSAGAIFPFNLRLALWGTVLSGFSTEKNASEMQRTLQLMQDRRLDTNDAHIAQTMTEFSASLDDFEAAKTWYDRVKRAGLENNPRANDAMQEALVGLCLRTSQFEFGQSVIRDMMKHTPSKRQWDLIFLWAAGTGKGVDEIDRMMRVMESKGRGSPDVETINRLVEFATSKKDPYMAERFIALGSKRDVLPDARTLSLQIEYRLSINDVDGALIAYKHLQTQQSPDHAASDHADVPMVNNLICAMCASRRQDFESIMNVAGDLSDRRARFEPATVSALSLLHLSRGESADVVDLLNTHIFRFSSAERASVRNTLVAYCLNPKSTVAEAWDAYTILKQIFDETQRDQRTRIMNDFFRRRRADMAVHVFHHMRAHTRQDTISTIDTYVSCLVGIAALKDAESLVVVHNQMKLDYSIEPNTRLLNALMLAYTACQSPRKALTFWNEIVSSREGPTLNSIHLAFRACEVSPWGDEKAQEIWARLVKTGIELDQSMWASYAAGLVGNGDVQGTIRRLEEAQEKGDVELNAFM